ncbi:putative Signal transduction histidine kinase [Candidatus Terasakiella magnetica]|nr:putative Signal transduction histidine kinase [Candidatus Terasakiella magnetica]
MPSNIFNLDGLTPHGFCLSWRPELFWSLAWADMLITLAYMSISATILVFIYRRRLMRLRWVGGLFAAFIMLCAFSHGMDVWTLWYPDYSIQAIEKVITATISIITAVLLWPLLPHALAIPSAAEQEIKIKARTQELHNKNELLLQMKDAAIESEERFRAIIECAPEAIMIFDVDLNRIIDVNEKTELLFACSRDRLLQGGPDRFYALQQPDGMDLEESMTRHNQRALSGEEVVFLRKIFTEDGKALICEVRLVRLPDRERRLVRASFIDITERQQNEEELRRHKNQLEELVKERTLSLEVAVDQAQAANRAKSEILTNMSHELRTPLNAVIGYSETLLTGIFGPSPNPKFAEYINDIHDSGQHLLAIINDILDVSAIDAGKMELHEEFLCVRDVVEMSIRLVAPRAEAAQVAVYDEVSPDLPRLCADERRLKQILLNLLSNAVKFIPHGGTVRITAQQTLAGEMVIAVIDTGIGMDQEGIAKALSIFGQVDSGLTRSREGSGIGLPLTVGLVELHGGTLTITSKKGVGTTVTVTFPATRVETV